MHTGWVLLAKLLITTAIAASPLYQAGQQIDIAGGGDMHAAGKDIVVTEPVDGDVVAAGQSIHIFEDVSDDVWVAGEMLTVDGVIGDDLRAVGAKVLINQSVRDHVLAAGEDILVGADVVVGGRTILAGEHVYLKGEYKQSVIVFAKDITVTGATFGEELSIYAAEEVMIDSETSIAGDLIVRAHTSADVVIDTDQIGGELIRKHLSKQDIDVVMTGKPLPLMRASPFLSQWILIVLLVWLIPKKMKKFRDVTLRRPLLSFGLGILAIPAYVILAVLLMMPFMLLAIMMLIATPVLLFLAGSVIPLYATVLTQRWGKKRSFLKETLIATVALFVIYTLIPGIGFLVSMIFMFVTLGGLVRCIKG